MKGDDVPVVGLLARVKLLYVKGSLLGNVKVCVDFLR